MESESGEEATGDALVLLGSLVVVVRVGSSSFEVYLSLSR